MSSLSYDSVDGTYFSLSTLYREIVFYTLWTKLPLLLSFGVLCVHVQVTGTVLNINVPRRPYIGSWGTLREGSVSLLSRCDGKRHD